MVPVFQVAVFGLGSALWAGVAVIVTGLIIRQVSLCLYKKEKHRYSQHFNPDMASSRNALETFFEGLEAERDASDSNYLWALLGDGFPCAIAYNKSRIIIIPASLNGERIIAREGKRIRLGIRSTGAIAMVWLVRKDDVSPVYEVDIQYIDGGSTSEIKLYRFELDVVASLNYHEFRKFVETLKTICHLHRIPIRDFIH